jgi:V8-like Glu-specific endopeptidase
MSPMVAPSSSFEEAQYSTVMIETFYQNGDSGTGTGFFFSYPVGDKFIFTIITNKHVVDGATGGRLRLHKAQTVSGKLRPTGEWFVYDISQMQHYWLQHPNPDIDLCAMIAGDMFDDCDKTNRPIYYVAASPEHVPNAVTLKSLRAVEDVYMIGYPNGLWDSINNFPLIRRGITASHPAINYCGKSEGVIDIAAFPGSSGSPVFIINDGWVTQADGSVQVGRRVILLGVLYAGPEITATGEIKRQFVPTTKRLVAELPMTMHLGYYIYSNEILTLCKALVCHGGYSLNEK